MQTSSPARRFERFPVQLSVVCGTDERRLADMVVNVSCAGACIQTPAPLPVNTEEHFYFTVPDARFHDVVVEVHAKVAWTRDNVMGLEFAEPARGIEDYVNRLAWLEKAF